MRDLPYRSRQQRVSAGLPNLLDVELEGLAIDRPLDEPGSSDAIVAQSGQKVMVCQ